MTTDGPYCWRSVSTPRDGDTRGIGDPGEKPECKKNLSAEKGHSIGRPGPVHSSWRVTPFPRQPSPRWSWDPSFPSLEATRASAHETGSVQGDCPRPDRDFPSTTAMASGPKPLPVQLPQDGCASCQEWGSGDEVDDSPWQVKAARTRGKEQPSALLCRRVSHSVHKGDMTQVSTDRRWINQTWLTHTMEYYSALKRKDIPTHATSWMNLEVITLSDISQPRKDEYCVSART
ncbi:uncharacterized protein LOC112484784 [Pteropus alecto]|uniref:uncharacterized protein LOC112484784 n=1 Tax=Pteropus alecto TaxID=9402 RepID=UPI000D53823E|nr:uncharacterized protein LOC112484784 [Pteropus alecto]XP_024906982.1 uncharacterized protein LOC112484784 [Pteropus alecto]